jgi:hypothetical protein
VVLDSGAQMTVEKILRAGFELGSLFCIFVVGCFCIYDKLFVSQYRKKQNEILDRISDLHATVASVEATVKVIAGNRKK